MTFNLLRFLTRLFVIPGVELEAAFDENRAALFQILTRDFGGAAPESHIDEGDFFALLAVIERVLPIHGDAEIGDRAAFRRVTHLRGRASGCPRRNTLL